jgi:hypothetical protein
MTADYPTKQDAKNIYYLAARARIELDYERLLVSTLNRNALGVLLDGSNNWIEVFGKHKSEDSDSTTIGKRVIALIDLVEAQLTKIYKDIPESALDTDDYTIFRFNPGSGGHTTIEAQKIPATLTLESTHHLGHKIRIKNPLTPDSSAMPYGNDAKIWSAVYDKKVDASLIVWGDNPQKATTRFYEKSFTENQVEMWAAYKTCYETATGKQGDPSEPLWVLIS